MNFGQSHSFRGELAASKLLLYHLKYVCSAHCSKVLGPNLLTFSWFRAVKAPISLRYLMMLDARLELIPET